MILSKKLYKPQNLIFTIFKTISVFIKYAFVDSKKITSLAKSVREQNNMNVSEKGFPILLFSKGKTKCTSCGLCEDVCPTDCIIVEASEKKTIQRIQVPTNFTLDYSNCIACGECVNVCGFNALKKEKSVDWVFDNLDSFVWDIDKYKYYYDNE